MCVVCGAFFHEIFSGDAQHFQEFVGLAVALGVDRRRIQRLLALAPVIDPQEPGGLLEGLGPDARHVTQLGPVGDRPRLLLAVGQDLAGAAGVEARHVLQEGERGRVEVHAHAIDHLLDALADRLRQALPIDIVLVQAHPDILHRDLQEMTWHVVISVTSVIIISIISTLMISLSGSWRRRAMETVPRCWASSSGNSWAASGEAE
jgi:hypothetical protein